MALSVPLSRFTSRVGGGSAFFVRPDYTLMVHHILSVVVEDTSATITLDGGASYTVAPDDVVTAAGWYGGQQVKIMPSRSREFPVRLHHHDTGVIIKARRLIHTDG